MKCTAPWYELNISAPDNVVSACCYYAGDKEPWRDEPTSLDAYWNSPSMQALRRLQTQLRTKNAAATHGCSSCFFYENSGPGRAYYDFSVPPPADLSDAQRANWLLAKREHDAGVECVTCVPLRLYANFGFACNINCIMCHQVPRRRENRRQVMAACILDWRDALKAAMSVTVIGGEPFALPEAISFIRQFAADPDFDAVNLAVHTNGTLHHKHMQSLRQKRKLTVCVSLNSIYQGYEHIRSGSQWDLVERNILLIKEIQQKERPEWGLTTNGLMLKSALPHLPEFAAWHVKHNIATGFFDFINHPGTEDTYFRENILQSPQVLDDMPEWQEYFTEAAETFRAGGMGYAADNLEQYRGRVLAAQEAARERHERHRLDCGRNDWTACAPAGEPERAGALVFSPGPHGGPAPIEVANGGRRFTRLRSGDHFATPFQPISPGWSGGRFRLIARWDGNDPDLRLAHVTLQCDGCRVVDGFRQWRSGTAGTELVMTGRIRADATVLRIVVTPTGEDHSYLPTSLRLDVDAETAVDEERRPHGGPGWKQLLPAPWKSFARRVANRLASSF